MISFTLNGETVSTDIDASTPLLWVIRDAFKLKGSKFGCGAGLCGACTMHVDGAAIKTCVTPIAAVAGKSITTIEGSARRMTCTHCKRRGMSMQCLNVATASRARSWLLRRS
jgi:aerobic-type carbon monoxide dehydrogenase small subunit (CoxS/CutS family)